jgi:predicted dehydrogenase
MIVNPSRIDLRSRFPRKLKWGVAGCGNFTETLFLPALQLVQRSKLVSVFSHDLVRAQFIASKFGAVGSFNDFDLFLNSDIDSVYIAGTNANHYEFVLKSARAGKNILCERPLALNSDQAGEMVNTCKANNVMLIVNHLHRYHPLVQKAKELVDKQMLGKIVSISASYNLNLPPDNNFRFKKELSGGGVLRDLGSNMIDLLRFFGGEITEAKGFLDNVVYKSEVEDYATAIVKFEQGGYGYFSVSYDSKKASNRIEITGHNGSMSIETLFAKKNAASKLVIDLNGEGKKVFRKRLNKIVFMLRSVQRSFIKHEYLNGSIADGIASLKIIEQLEQQCLSK